MRTRNKRIAPVFLALVMAGIPAAGFAQSRDGRHRCCPQVPAETTPQQAPQRQRQWLWLWQNQGNYQRFADLGVVQVRDDLRWRDDHGYDRRGYLYPYTTPYYYSAPYYPIPYSNPYPDPNYYYTASYSLGYRDGFNTGRSDFLNGLDFDPFRYEINRDSDYISGFEVGYEEGYGQ